MTGSPADDDYATLSGYWQGWEPEPVPDERPDGTWSTSDLHAAMEDAHKTGISITCSQDRHGSCFGCRCDCH